MSVDEAHGITGAPVAGAHHGGQCHSAEPRGLPGRLSPVLAMDTTRSGSPKPSLIQEHFY